MLLLTCSYNDTEFIRVGYYVNNEYADEALREDPPATVRLDRVVRNILAEKPRVTRFPCEFDASAIPAAGEMDEEETENQPVAAGGCTPRPRTTMAHDAHAYAAVPARRCSRRGGLPTPPRGYAAAGDVRANGRRVARRSARRTWGSGTAARRAGHGWRRCTGARPSGASLSLVSPARKNLTRSNRDVSEIKRTRFKNTFVVYGHRPRRFARALASSTRPTRRSSRRRRRVTLKSHASPAAHFHGRVADENLRIRIVSTQSPS